jgi:hypothetical protein
MISRCFLMENGPWPRSGFPFCSDARGRGLGAMLERSPLPREVVAETAEKCDEVPCFYTFVYVCTYVFIYTIYIYIYIYLYIYIYIDHDRSTDAPGCFDGRVRVSQRRGRSRGYCLGPNIWAHHGPINGVNTGPAKRGPNFGRAADDRVVIPRMIWAIYGRPTLLNGKK